MDQKRILASIENIPIKDAFTDKETNIGELWRHHDCVIYIIRRLGWSFNRVHVRCISGLKSDLDARGIRLVCIGMDTNSIDDFFKVTGYEGKLYIDENEECYRALQLKRITPLNALPMIFSKTARNGIRQIKEQGVGGNLRGDGYQLGGVLIVRRGGDIVVFRRQESPAQLPMEPNNVLQIIDEKSLGRRQNDMTILKGPEQNTSFAEETVPLEALRSE